MYAKLILQGKGIENTRHRVLNSYIKQYQQMLSLSKNQEVTIQQDAEKAVSEKDTAKGTKQERKKKVKTVIDPTGDPSITAITKMPIDYQEFHLITLAKDPLKQDVNEIRFQDFSKKGSKEPQKSKTQSTQIY